MQDRCWVTFVADAVPEDCVYRRTRVLVQPSRGGRLLARDGGSKQFARHAKRESALEFAAPRAKPTQPFGALQHGALADARRSQDQHARPSARPGGVNGGCDRRRLRLAL